MATVKDLEVECLTTTSDPEKNNTALECSEKTETVKMSELQCLKSDPIKNDLILSNIFRFCDVPSLKNCRLVSSKWRDLSLKAWRRKAMLQLGLGEGYGYLQSDEFQNMIKINPEGGGDDNNSLQLRKHPFKRYSLKFEQCMERGDEGECSDHERMAEAISAFPACHIKILWDSPWFDRFPEFLSVLNSNTVTSLEVRWRTLNEAYPRSLEPLTCSNIKRLKLVTHTLLPNHSWLRSLRRFLLKSCPQVEALAVEYDMEGNDIQYSIIVDERLGIVNQLKSMRQTGGDGESPRFPLKEFEMINFHSKQDSVSGVGSNKEAEIIKTLVECNFPLERLSIHAGWNFGDNDKVLILPLLESCKETLQFLRASIYVSVSLVSGNYGYSKHTGRLESFLGPLRDEDTRVGIRMEVLRELNLLNGLQWAMFLLGFLELPQLKKLVVEYHEKRTHCNMFGLVIMHSQVGKVFGQLETLEIWDDRQIIGENILRAFARMMPNLTHLTIPLDKRSFPVVCHYFKGLKTLNVLHAKGDYVELDDEALTGVTQAEVEVEGVPSRRPNLTDLVHLTDLRISCERMLLREDVKITEHSVIHGFLQLSRLYYLSVAINELSEEVMDQLRNHVKGNLELQMKPWPDPDSYEFEIF